MVDEAELQRLLGAVVLAASRCVQRAEYLRGRYLASDTGRVAVRAAEDALTAMSTAVDGLRTAVIGATVDERKGSPPRTDPS